MTRVTTEQSQILMSEYQRNPVWSKQLINQLAERPNLPQVKVYKWNWDQRNKTRDQLPEEDEDDSDSDERVSVNVKARDRFTNNQRDL